MSEPKRLGDVLREVEAQPKFYGIPTEYKGVQFRSRLEARWAAFFDQCAWPWTYEPFDLKGWIPDFLLGECLVEVKPFTKFEEWEVEIKTIWLARKSVQCRREVLLLGTSPFCAVNCCCSEVAIGWLGEHQDFMCDGEPMPDNDLWYEPAPLGVTGITREGRRILDFCHDFGSYRCRMFGSYNGSQPDCEKEIIEDLWAAACNATQWNPPHGHR